ncbi:MAG TPA: glycosyltransferase family 4 protein [Thermoanaerobaculia bacterium]|nr:glycosyltransferase family 4 protein [Thermoanaerobaculia bacterium]
MRILNLVAGKKWTGTAAVVCDQTAALVEAGIEAQFGFVGDSPLEQRLMPLGWARPILRPMRAPLDYARDVRGLAEALRRERFDLVHAHATHDHHVAAWAVRGTTTKMVRTLHTLRHVRKDGVTRALYSRTRAFAFANSAIAAAYGATGPIHAPVVDSIRFHPAESLEAPRAYLGLPRDRILVGTVGKMAAGRGHRSAILACAGIPQVELVHVGHGELQPVLREVAARAGSAARNHWIGYEEARLPDLYRSWDIFLFPASGSDQGQRAILEALASGVPIVAVDVPGVRDLVTDGREAVIVSGRGGMRDAVERLAVDPDLRRAMGARGRERAHAFQAKEFARKAAEFYEQAMRRSA